MTDSHHTPNQSPSGSPDYEGSDPDLPEDGSSKRVPMAQVGASAAAAVTSALAASFFGVAGTLIGAAVGSIVSTIAGALYVDYLNRAGRRIKTTKDVVIQRIPSEVLATTPLRHLTGPSDLPGRESLRPVGDENGDETVALPVEDATELLRRPEGTAVLEQTTVMPAVGSPAAEAALRELRAGRGAGSAGAGADGRTNGAGANGVRPAGANGAGANSRPAGAPGTPVVRPRFRRSVWALATVSAAGFLIALGVVLSTEGIIGRPISGGESGNSISRITSNTNDTGTEQESTTPAPTSSATEEPSATGSGTPSEAPTTDPAPASTATTAPAATSDDAAPTATTAPTAQSTGEASIAPQSTSTP